MKNNKLHIVYSGEPAPMQSPTGVKNKGYIESMRCTKLERAQEIVRGIYPESVESATFKDKTGKETKIK